MGWLKTLFKQNKRKIWFKINNDTFKKGYYFVSSNGVTDKDKYIGLCYVTKQNCHSYQGYRYRNKNIDNWDYGNRIKLSNIPIEQTVNMYKKEMLNELNT